jgi:hypothetical protein
LDLKDGSGVVVQAPNQAMVDFKGNFKQLQVSLQSIEVVITLGAKVVRASGGGAGCLLTRRLFTVKEAKRVSL